MCGENLYFSIKKKKYQLIKKSFNTLGNTISNNIFKIKISTDVPNGI